MDPQPSKGFCMHRTLSRAGPLTLARSPKKPWHSTLTLHGLLHDAADAHGRRAVDGRVRALQAHRPAGLWLLAVELRVELLERPER